MGLLDELLIHEAESELERRACETHPAYLLEHVRCVDAKTGETFTFQLLDTDAPWHWQREVVDGWLLDDASIVLKARQLGITWLAAGVGLWTLLYKPGTTVLIVSINETEASKVVNRLWDMLHSLPLHLWNGAKVIKPTRGVRPFNAIGLEFPDGRISSVLALASTKTAGHGETAAVVILDEYARQEYARETWNAVVPTMADGGKLIVISTANGISTSEEEGNFFHHLWKNHRELGIERRFLSWKCHPDRDEDWYRGLSMPIRAKAEQYPDDADEAFLLTGDQYFDPESLFWYAKNAVTAELYSLDFLDLGQGKANGHRKQNGYIRVFREPVKGHTYAIGIDVATGRGKDYSCAFVIDLGTMEFVAEFHGRVDADVYAMHLHYLGKWYQNARMAVELGGGYGEAVVIPLRDGRDGRPPYPMLYRHRQDGRIDRPGSKQIGFPMTMKTRPLVLSQLEQVIREREMREMPSDLISECQTFTYQKNLPSPRAQDGANDDRVMAAAITLEMYRRYGQHSGKWSPQKAEKRDLTSKVRLDGRHFDKRYGKAS